MRSSSPTCSSARRSTATSWARPGSARRGRPAALAEIGALPLTEKRELKATCTPENPVGAHLCVEAVGDRPDLLDQRHHRDAELHPAHRRGSRQLGDGLGAQLLGLRAWSPASGSSAPTTPGRSSRAQRSRPSTGSASATSRSAPVTASGSLLAIEMLEPEAAVLTPSYASYLLEWAAERDVDLRGSSVRARARRGRARRRRASLPREARAGVGGEGHRGDGDRRHRPLALGRVRGPGRDAPRRPRLRPRRADRPRERRARSSSPTAPPASWCSPISATARRRCCASAPATTSSCGRAPAPAVARPPRALHRAHRRHADRARRQRLPLGRPRGRERLRARGERQHPRPAARSRRQAGAAASGHASSSPARSAGDEELADGDPRADPRACSSSRRGSSSFPGAALRGASTNRSSSSSEQVSDAQAPDPGRPPHHARRSRPADLDRLLGRRARDAVRVRAAEPRQPAREPPLLRPRRRAADHGLHQRGARRPTRAAPRPRSAASTTSRSRSRKATFDQAVERLDERGVRHSGVKDRGFMDSIYFEDPLGLLIELSAYRFEPPAGLHACRGAARGARDPRRPRRPPHRPGPPRRRDRGARRALASLALRRPLPQASLLTNGRPRRARSARLRPLAQGRTTRPARPEACASRVGRPRTAASRRLAASSASRSIPVSIPISFSIETRSSVAMFPVAPAGTGQPPISPKLDSNDSQPASSAASTFARPWPRVLWKWAVSSVPASASCAPVKKAATCTGFAIPVVSAKPISCAPAADQPAGELEHAPGLDAAFVGAAEADADHGGGAQALGAGAPDHPCELGERLLDGAVEVLAVVALRGREEAAHLLEAVRGARAPARARARSGRVRSPRRSQAARRRRAPARRRRAAGSPRGGRTRSARSARARCARARRSARSCRRSAISSGSFWNPSRGPTSRMRTRAGSSSFTSPPQYFHGYTVA